MENVSVFLLLFFIKKKIDVLYLYYTHIVLFPFPYISTEFLKHTFYERLRVIPVRIITVSYTYHILLTIPTITNSKIHPHAKCKIK